MKWTLYWNLFQERLVIQDRARAGNTETYQVYLKWANESGIRRPLGRKAFTQALKARGYEQANDQGRYWRGLGIRDDRPLE